MASDLMQGMEVGLACSRISRQQSFREDMTALSCLRQLPAVMMEAYLGSWSFVGWDTSTGSHGQSCIKALCRTHTGYTGHMGVLLEHSAWAALHM